MSREVRMRYCPECGGLFTIRQIGNPLAPPRLVCSACSLVWHPDPKVACAALLVQNGAVLLLKRARPPQKGFWCLPGGFVDRGETMEGATVREVREETGIEVRIRRLFGLYSYDGYPVVVGIYEVEPRGDPVSVAISPESAEHRWFEPQEIPWEELAFPSTADALGALLRIGG